MTRAPVFRVADVTEGAEVAEWVGENVDVLAEAAESTTSHGELQDVTPYVVGDNVYLRFSYDTKDAMGMNMATIATEAASEVVERETPAELVALSGNLCTDKKPAAINAVEGRGRSVTADVTIPATSSRTASTRPRRPSRRPTRGRTSSAPRRPEASGSTPTRRTSSRPSSSRPARTPPRSSRGRTPSPPSRHGTRRSTPP